MGLTHLLTESITSGSFFVYGAIFLTGLISSFTPCTYPVLPLTIGYVGGASEGKKSRGFILSLALVFGMAGTYAILGTILASMGLQFGIIWSNGWAMYGIAMFFIVMSLFLLDVFTFPTAGFLEKFRITTTQNQRGLLGAFLVGGVSGLIVGPCTGPILAIVTGAIVLSLQEAEGLAYAGILLNAAFKYFLFGLGQGALIILCGTFAGLLTVLPKSGQWMITLKKIFALVVIVGASFLLVYVGQSTDFPNLIGLLASLEQDRAVEQVTVPEEQVEYPEVEKAFEEMEQEQEQPTSAVPTTTEDSLAFTAPLYKGGTFDSSEVIGKKPVIFVFFATWCPYCMKEVPTVNKLAKRGQNEGFSIYGVNYQQTEKIVEQFHNEYDISYPIIMDKEGEITRKYRVFGIPFIIGFDSSGTIRFEGTEFPEDLDAFIDDLKGTRE